MVFIEFAYIEWVNLALSILFFVACTGICLYGMIKIQVTEDLESEEFLRGHQVFVEGLKVDSKLAAQYLNLKIIRKMSIAVVIIFIDDGCIQT